MGVHMSPLANFSKVSCINSGYNFCCSGFLGLFFFLFFALSIIIIFLLSAFLQEFFLWTTERWWPPHLAQPCCVALGRALIRGLYPDWFEGFVNWVPLPRLGPAVDHDGVTAKVDSRGFFNGFVCSRILLSILVHTLFIMYGIIINTDYV